VAVNQPTEGVTFAVRPRLFARAKSLLGEGPVWDARREGLFWLDILGLRLYFKPLSNAAEESWNLPCLCSAIFLPESDFGGVLLATECGLASFDLTTARFQVLATSGDETASMRSNDGGVDPVGRIWFGTMSKNVGDAPGAIYRWDGGDRLQRVLSDVYIPNTFLWNQTGTMMVSADSYQRIISRYAFDLAGGAPTHGQVIVNTTATGFEPDGSAMDTNGFFWNAQWNGTRIVCYDLNGSVKQQISLPVARPTSCCFGGADLGTLFITSASIDLDELQRSQYPESGSVLALDVGVKGRSVHRAIGVNSSGELP
jgi:L-arabinonolactonase